MTPSQRPITAFIDVLNYRARQFFTLLMVPIIAVVDYEVLSRNIDAILKDADMGWVGKALGLDPTLQVYDTSRMISGVLFMGAAGYGLIRGVHIRADGSYRNWEKNTSYRGLKLISLIFIPSMIFFTIVSTKFWWLAYSTSETMQIDSAWGPLLWPAHTAMPAGEFLLLIQGIPEIFHAIYKMGRARERVFVKALPFYVIVLLWFILTVFIPDLVPGGEWFTDLMKARPGLSKPTIGLIMLSAMLFVIFIRFPISFTLIFLAFIFGICGANFKLTTLLFTLNTNSTMLNDQFMAVPLFFLIGIIMERAGLIVLTIFAAATGIVCASMTLLGIMAEAKMNKQNKMFKLLLAPLLQARHLAF